MDPASFGLSILQGIDICLRYGRFVIEKIHAYKKSNDRLTNLILRMQAIWMKTSCQLETLRRVWQCLDKTLLAHQEQVLAKLQVRLQTAMTTLSSYTGDENSHEPDTSEVTVDLTRWKKLRYSAFEKNLKHIVEDLESWHAQFDLSWYLTNLDQNRTFYDRLNNGGIAKGDNTADTIKRIREAIYETRGMRRSLIRPIEFVARERENIAYSNCALVQTQEDVKVVAEVTDYPRSTDMNLALAHICDLARILAQCTPSTIGLLNCLGIAKVAGQFEILYAFPSNSGSTQPVSLRSLLLSKQLEPSVNTKLYLARCLIRAVISVHTAALVHKNIRPEALLIFPETEDYIIKANSATDAKGPRVPRLKFHEQEIRAFLIGFEQFRPAAAGTSLVGDMIWERNLYRHPKRQGVHPADRYEMRHDIYSLGVVLLELGLWMSFVLSSQDTLDASATSREKGEALVPNQILEIEDELEEKIQGKAARNIKNRLVTMADELLPRRMGDTYAEVVKSCLTCLDRGETNIFTEDLDIDEEEENGIMIGIEYIEKVMVKIEELRF